MNVSKKGIKFLSVGFIFWLFLLLIFPPFFSGTDIFSFKGAGIYFSKGLGLVERFSPITKTVELTPYAIYPPLYPFFFGLFSLVLGIGPKVSGIFNLVNTFFATLVFWLAISPRSHRPAAFSDILIMIILFFLIPIAPFWAEPERPDPLTFAVTVLSWLLILGPLNNRRVFVSGFIWGVNGLISPFGFIANGVGSFLFLWTKEKSENESPLLKIKIKNLFIFCLGCVPPLFCGLIYFISTNYLTRFFGHAMGVSNNNGLGILLTLFSGNYTAYFNSFIPHNNNDLLRLILALFSFGLILITTLIYRNLLSLRELRSLWFILFSYFVLSFVMFPYQRNYMLLVSGLLIVIANNIISEHNSEALLIFRQVTLIFLSVLFLVSLPFQVRDFAVAWQSRSSFERMSLIVKDICLSGEPVLVATHSTNFFVFRANNCDVVDIGSLDDSAKREKIDYFAISFIGSKDPFKTAPLPWWNPEKFELLYRPILPQQTNILGWQSNSSNTWEVELYKKKQ